MDGHTFGGFIAKKREGHDYTLRGFAGMLGISAVYLSNLEKDRRRDPSDEIVDNIATLLHMSRDEKTEMLDLLAKAKKKPAVANDLPEYINERDIVRVALRTAKDVDATDEEWQEFIERLQKRIIRDTPPDDDGG
jgi:transcriptional regulator with XRE-family HTH domain